MLGPGWPAHRNVASQSGHCSTRLPTPTVLARIVVIGGHWKSIPGPRRRGLGQAPIDASPAVAERRIPRPRRQANRANADAGRGLHRSRSRNTQSAEHGRCTVRVARESARRSRLMWRTPSLTGTAAVTRFRGTWPDVEGKPICHGFGCSARRLTRGTSGCALTARSCVGARLRCQVADVHFRRLVRA